MTPPERRGNDSVLRACPSLRLRVCRCLLASRAAAKPGTSTASAKQWHAFSGVVFVLATCFAASSIVSAAHPVSLTRTSVYVTEERAAASIEVFLEDLFLFHDLKPNDRDFLEPDAIRRGIELHKRFVAERFMIRDVAGERVAGRVVGIAGFEMPDEGVAVAELMAHRLTFELQYEFPKPPEFLTFSQQFTDEQAVLPSEMKLSVKQENVAEPQTLELRPGDVETIAFHWNLPPLTAEASDEERQAWVAQQQEETLGITSYSSVYSFLYIGDGEVRHEILVPLLSLEESVLIARDGDEFLDLAEQDVARVQIEAYFRTGNPVEIDGVEVAPIVQRCDFYGLDFRDFARQAPRKRVPMLSARVGIILAYPCGSSPQRVKLTWNRFNNFMRTVRTVVFAYEDTQKTTLTRLGKRNTFEWTNPGRPAVAPIAQVEAETRPRPTLSLPVVSLGFVLAVPIVLLVAGPRRPRALFVAAVLLAGAAAAWPWSRWEVPRPFPADRPIADDRADAVFAQLHHNIYRAFQFHEEEDVYDALAKSIRGDLLREVYLEIRRGLEMQEQGGAVSRIEEVSILSGQTEPWTGDAPERPDAEEGFAYRCRWNVAGSVEHWGHIHQRTNQYEARFGVEQVDNVWKVTTMQLLDEQRVNFETRLRSL